MFPCQVSKYRRIGTFEKGHIHQNNSICFNNFLANQLLSVRKTGNVVTGINLASTEWLRIYSQKLNVLVLKIFTWTELCDDVFNQFCPLLFSVLLGESILHRVEKVKNSRLLICEIYDHLYFGTEWRAQKYKTSQLQWYCVFRTIQRPH